MTKQRGYAQSVVDLQKIDPSTSSQQIMMYVMPMLQNSKDSINADFFLQATFLDMNYNLKYNNSHADPKALF